MQRIVQRFASHAEADLAERRYYASLPPQERVDLLLDLIRRYRESQGESAQRFERVHRVVELSES